MRAFLLLLVATAGLVWFGRIDVINHAETVVISGSARLRGLQHYAVGVNTGGPKAPAAIDALWKGHLRFFTNIIIMGDVADAKRQIRTPPKRYYCTHNSAFGPSLDDKLVWKSHGRCTQLRFLYLVLTLREEFPDAAYYLLLDDDAWIDPRGLADLLGNYDTTPRGSWVRRTRTTRRVPGGRHARDEPPARAALRPRRSCSVRRIGSSPPTSGQMPRQARVLPQDCPSSLGARPAHEQVWWAEAARLQTCAKQLAARRTSAGSSTRASTDADALGRRAGGEPLPCTATTASSRSAR